jgi:hypothetical protein
MTIGLPNIEYEDEELEALYKSVGFIVVQWGLAEQSLDLIVATIFHELEGKRLAKNNRLPIALTTKLDFISKCLSQLPKLASFKVEGTALLQNFSTLGQRRNDLVHGAIASLSPVDGAFVFNKLDTKPDFHYVREVRLEASEFPAFTKSLIDLGAKTTSFANKIWSHAIKN